MLEDPDILDTLLGPIDTSTVGGAIDDYMRKAYYVLEPGVISKYMQQREGSYALVADPGIDCRFDYTNLGFMVLTECLGNFLRQDPAEYGDLAREELLERCGVPRQLILDRAGIYGGRGWAKARARNESPCQTRFPGTIWNRFEPLNEDFPMFSPPYGVNLPLFGGDGGWCVPLWWMARVFACLSDAPLPGLPVYLDRSTIEQMATRACDDVPGQAMGIFRVSETEGGNKIHYGYRRFGDQPWSPYLTAGTELVADQDVIRLHHNGAVWGGGAFFMHQIPLTMSQPSVRRGDALTVGFASNQKTGNNIVGRFDEIFDILNAGEERDTFPSEDLFDVLL